jgi:hypothetical protein
VRFLHPIGLALFVACTSAGGLEERPAASPDPSEGEVALPCAPGWEARLLLDNDGVGVWTVRAFGVFEQYAVPEVVGLDDLGRCHVLISYSGKWTDRPRVHDGRWLGGLDHADVDPRVPGSELYAGGAGGNLYQLVAHPHGALDARLIAHLPGHEIHTVLGGELDPSNDVAELLVFTRPGALYRVTPDGPHGRFEVERLATLPGRVRDATVLPAEAGEPPRLATVSRDGALRLVWLEDGRPRSVEVHREPMGMGRVALRRGGGDEPLVLYTTLDDGRVLRHQRSGGRWSLETILAGPQGPRGVVSGRFGTDPEVEEVAVFGYSGKVQLLRRAPDGSWSASTLFTDEDRGHWLAVAELDGRNATDEILGSGYAGRVFLLARPPGFGR